MSKRPSISKRPAEYGSSFSNSNYGFVFSSDLEDWYGSKGERARVRMRDNWAEQRERDLAKKEQIAFKKQSA